MTNQDARNFVMTMNVIQPYVPPNIFAQLMGNPICREIEAAANAPGPGEQQPGATPPAKPNGGGVNPSNG